MKKEKVVRFISQFFKNVVPIVPGLERKKSSSDQLKTQKFFGASRQKFCSANSSRSWNTVHKYTCAINFVYVVITVLVPEIFCKKVVPIVPSSLSITQVYWVLVTVGLSRVHVKEVKLTYGFPLNLCQNFCNKNTNSLMPEIFCKKIVPIVPPSLSITQVYWVLVTVRLSRVHVKEVKLTYGFPFKLVSKNYTVNFIDLCQKNKL